MKKWDWLIVPSLFLVPIVACTALAWDGSRLALITLAVISGFLALAIGFYIWNLAAALAGWAHSNEHWMATQRLSMSLDQILGEALQELAPHDAEAVAIHGGRALDAHLTFAEQVTSEESP